MKVKTLFWSLFILVLLTNVWAIFTEVFWLENATYIFYFLSALLLGISSYRKFNNRLYVFFGFTILSYLVRSFKGELYSNEVALVLSSVAYISLVLEAVKHIEIKNASNYMLFYFIAIIGINGCLLGYHVLEIKDFMPGNFVFSVYVLYYINLLILGIIAFIYYLNSYSRKSMFFISLALGIIFADVLRDMAVFFPKDQSVEVAESLIRSGCAVFAVMFFITKEKQLRLLNML